MSTYNFGVVVCPICLEKIGKRGFKKCSNQHRFHKKCLTQWLKDNETCPSCRVEITHLGEKRNNRPSFNPNQVIIHSQVRRNINDAITDLDRRRNYDIEFINNNTLDEYLILVRDGNIAEMYENMSPIDNNEELFLGLLGNVNDTVDVTELTYY